MTETYIHGYSEEERLRLTAQADILAPGVFGGLDFSGDRTLLEIGCATGEELRILARAWPNLQLTGLDRSEDHLAWGEQALAEEIRAGNIRLVRGDAYAMPFENAVFDVVLTVWMLEHVQDHAGILREALRVLRPEGRVILVEVDNSTFTLDPPVPEILDWWDRFSRYQEAAGGDPYAGGKLKAAAESVGAFGIVEERLEILSSRREPERRSEWLVYLKDLLLSGADNMIRGGYADAAMAARVGATFDALHGRPEVDFSYSGVRLTCRRADDQGMRNDRRGP